MKLLAYKINGKIVNKEIFNWTFNDLNGNKPWVVSEYELPNYADITSIENWDTYSLYIEKDFLFIRQMIKLILDVSWTDKEGNLRKYSDNLNVKEGLISSKYFLVSKDIRDVYLSDIDQQIYWKELIEKSQQSRLKRWESAKTYISYYLSPIDSSDLARQTSELCNNYINYNIITKSKDGISGLFDYLRGAEDYLNIGFPSKSYWSQSFQDKLLDILENGNY